MRWRKRRTRPFTNAGTNPVSARQNSPEDAPLGAISPRKPRQCLSLASDSALPQNSAFNSRHARIICQRRVPNGNAPFLFAFDLQIARFVALANAPLFTVHRSQFTAIVTDILWAGLAMMLIFEGLLPLFAPQAWRETMARILAFKDGQLRFVGLASVIGGLLLLAWVKQ
ncbi:MAG: DUF2065 domain-containing protein [Betaproteobacteria bacterium]|nr:DUF2065 domain-containing protein [Betaproteobacteria bacterium]